MRAFEIQQGFGIDNLRLVERGSPPLDARSVRIDVLAQSVNYRDWMMIEGLYNPRQALPLIPLSDGVGRVVEVGSEVRRVKVGDRVAGTFFQGWNAGLPPIDSGIIRQTLGGPLDGMLAEEVVLSEEGVVKVPEHLSDVEAATLPCAALTAWSALIWQGKLKAGDTVLLQGTGGVSLFALQFAKMSGARVIISSKSDEKLERAKALGADLTINYKTDTNWGKTARSMTDGLGVDHVVEVGGAATLNQSLKAVRPGGRISVIGVLGSTQAPISILPILMQNLTLQGVLVGPREAFDEMNRAIAQAQLKPVVDTVYPFEEAPKALRALTQGAHFGKICLSRS